MPELRKDPVIGRWVIVATERARRPGNFVASNDERFQDTRTQCPYCPPLKDMICSFRVGGDLKLEKELDPHPKNGKRWDVCVIEFKNSFFSLEEDPKQLDKGLYEVINGYGSHEVIVETPKHIDNLADLPVEQVQCVLETYALRIKTLEKNSFFQHVMAFKNFGATAGSRNIEHARSHIIATPITPLRVREKLKSSEEYFEAKKRCVYCDLMEEELRDKKRIVLENEHFLAITPFAARFLFEVWILPKKHCCDFTAGLEGGEADLAQMLKMLLLKFKIGLDDPAYNYIIQTAPFRRKTGQIDSLIDVDFHWHIELMPRLTRVAGFEKGTGFYINSISPEMTAEYLRGVFL